MYKSRYFVGGVEVPYETALRLIHLRKIKSGSWSILLSEVPNIKTYTQGTMIISELDDEDALLRHGLEATDLGIKDTLIITNTPAPGCKSDPLSNRTRTYIFDCRKK